MAASRFKHLLADLKEKYSYRELAVILKDAGLGTDSGWQALLERLDGADATFAAKAEKVLGELHTGLILGGTKDVFSFDLEATSAAAVERELSTIQPGKGHYGSAYPLSLEESELKKLPPDHELVHKVVFSAALSTMPRS